MNKAKDLRLLRHLPASAWARYGIALAAFLVSFFLREALAPWLSSDRGIIVFLPAILFVTFCAGLGPGLLTTLLSGIALWYVFLPPYYSFAFSLDTAVGLATLAFGSIAGVTLVHLLQIATARAKTEQERSAALAASVTADLVGMTQLNNLSSLLVREGKDLKTCLNHVLETAIAITSADKGNVQLFDGNAVALTIAAHRRFEDNFLKFFEEVRGDNTACGEAMRSAKRVIVEDVMRSEIFAAAEPSLRVLVDAGVRAVMSTPLTSGNGGLLGMISVHFMKPHHPAEPELRLMDLLARQAADYLERKRAEEVEQYLVREVQHRSNNLLAVIQAIAHRSLSGEYSLADAKAAFEARLQALARANRQLTRSSWSGVDLTDLARLELEPFGDRSTIRGINVILDAQHAQNFTLALHELATNATKYGALSNDRGKVMASWAVMSENQNNRLNFKWQETEGPPVAEPTRQGFGSSLIKGMFSNVRFDYAPEGLTCEIDVLLQPSAPSAINTIRSGNQAQVGS
ncbi:MAG: HWE histidine kinase domain-containing protein [Xanthobacteraceae bacterium]